MKSFQKESRAIWRCRVDTWKESGLTVREFCVQQGIAEGRFYDWRKRFGFGAKAESKNATIHGRSAKSAMNFLPVQIKELPVNEITTRILAPQRVEIFLNNGSVVRISGELSDDNLSKIMKLARIMLSLPPSVRIYLCVQPTDMRKGFDSLAMLVKDQFGCDPLSGHLFVFTSKGHDRIKLLYWDRSGFAIIYKRLEQGVFKLPKPLNNEIKALEIDTADIMALLHGFELVKVKRQLRYEQKSQLCTNV